MERGFETCLKFWCDKLDCNISGDISNSLKSHDIKFKIIKVKLLFNYLGICFLKKLQIKKIVDSMR